MPEDDQPTLYALCAEYRVSMPEPLDVEKLQHLVNSVLEEVELPSWIERDSSYAVVSPLDEPLTKASISLVLTTFMSRDAKSGWNDRMVSFDTLFRRAIFEKKQQYYGLES